MGYGYKKGFGFALPCNKSGKCALCEKEKKDLESLVGGPVGLICPACRNIVTSWEEGKDRQRDWWRKCNGVEPAIENCEGMGRRIMEIEIYLAEIDRALQNQITSKKEIAERNNKEIDTSYQDDIASEMRGIREYIHNLKYILDTRNHGVKYDHFEVENNDQMEKQNG